MIPLEEGVKMLISFNDISDTYISSDAAKTAWLKMTDIEKHYVITAYNLIKKLDGDPKPSRPHKSMRVGCALQVTVDDRGPIWVTGYVVKRFEYVREPQYAVCCDDRLYYVDADKVFINAADLKSRIEEVVGDIL